MRQNSRGGPSYQHPSHYTQPASHLPPCSELPNSSVSSPRTLPCRAMSLRREATTALLGLFEFRGVSWHRGRRSQAARQDPGLTIIDDDEDLGSFASAGGGEGGEEFPWLSERIEGIGVQGASADPTYSRLAQDLERREWPLCARTRRHWPRSACLLDCD